MIEKYGFFDSTNEDEREYSEEDFARFGRVLALDGVRGGTDALEVSAYASGVAVKVSGGFAMVRGRYYSLEDDGSGVKVLNLSSATRNPRIDRIVIRLTYSTRKIEVGVLQGTENAQPTPPQLQRDTSVYMLSLAQVRVAVGAKTITSENIIDERSDEELCGIMGTSADAAMRKAQEAAAAAENAQKTANSSESAAKAAQNTANTAVGRLDAMKTIGSGVNGNLLVFDENGNAKDSGKPAAKLGDGVRFTLSGTVLSIDTV